MKKLFVAVLLVAGTAFAGEQLLGVIQQFGTTKSNVSQNPDGGYNFWDGGFNQPFCIPEMAKISIQCTNEVYVCTDKTSCTAVEGVAISTGVLLPTSVGSAKAGIYTSGVTDGGMAGSGSQTRCAVVSVLDQVSDGGYHACKVFERTGRE